MKFRLWPSSLAARTALVLLAGLAVVQMAGLTIHALDRLDVQRLAQSRDLAIRVAGVYRTMALTDPSRRATVITEMHRGPDLLATLSASPPQVDLPEMPIPETFTEADAHALANQPLAITQEIQPAPVDTTPAAPEVPRDAKAS